MTDIEKLASLIEECDKIVFFGGAGVSTESNIPDFRSVDGLYNQKYKYPPETILSHEFFKKKTEEFYDFYRDKMLFPDALPNDAHKFLASLEERGKLLGVITQNIDGLHQKAGNKKVYELHGSVHRNYCMKCHKFYSMADIMKSEERVPHCSCGGIIKPDVVLYGESLDEECIVKSLDILEKADLLIVGGTSLNVYPAAGFLNYFGGEHIVLINKSETFLTDRAEISINKKIGETFREVSRILGY